MARPEGFEPPTVGSEGRSCCDYLRIEKVAPGRFRLEVERPLTLGRVEGGAGFEGGWSLAAVRYDVGRRSRSRATHR